MSHPPIGSLCSLSSISHNGGFNTKRSLIKRREAVLQASTEPCVPFLIPRPFDSSLLRREGCSRKREEKFGKKLLHKNGPIRPLIMQIFFWFNNGPFRPGTMETRCFHKKLEFQKYPPKDFCTARYKRKSSKQKNSNFFKTPKKNIPGPILGQDRSEKNSAKCLFEAARFRVLDRHRATKPTTGP